MALTIAPRELALFDRMVRDHMFGSIRDTRHNNYYEGINRLVRLGIAVPPQLQELETCIGWAALTVDSVVERQKVKSFMLPGVQLADETLQEGWEANNMDSQQSMLWNDKGVYGRGFTAVGTNAEDPDHPLITIESPREMSVIVNPATGRVNSALKLYSGNGPTDPSTLLGLGDQATLYLPNSTIWLSKSATDGRWYVVDRDDHELGRVPVTPFWNRRRTGNWTGQSEMHQSIPLVDAACRAVTNLQLAQETHAVPQRYVLGANKGDFVGKDGKIQPAWEAYFSSVWVTGSKDSSVGQFSASDLRNFTETITFYGGLIAGLYGLPLRFMGQNTANPPSAEGIRADETRLIARVDARNAEAADPLGTTMGLYLRLKTGKWVDGNRITPEFYDAGTPTKATLTDSVIKLMSGVTPLLSREGAWDELGWNEARKNRERDYFREQENDPEMQAILSAARDAATPTPTPTPTPPAPVTDQAA